jgi:hypothetical protein
MIHTTALWVSLLLAAQIPAPPVIPKDHGKVAASTTDGKPRWTASWTMEPWISGGKRAVRFTETGSGRYSPFSQDVQWSLESIWLADKDYFPLQFQRTIRDMQGRILAVEKKNFDPLSGKAKFERQNEKGSTETSTFAAAANTLTIEGIAGILENFPFEKSEAIQAHFLSNEPKLYDVTIEPRGKERVKTATGSIDCYKIEMVPHLGLLNVARPFYPKTFFWFSAANPHAWVRYQGLENGPGSPEIVMEAR